MSRKQKMARSAEKKPEPPPKARPEPLPELVPAVSLIREGPEGWRVVLMHLPYEVMIEHGTHLFEPDSREMNEAQMLGVFQRWREDGKL